MVRHHLLSLLLCLLPVRRGVDAAVLSAHNSSTVQPSVLYSWTLIDFDWESVGTSRDEALASGAFIPENCALAGLKFYAGDAYVTIPRWKPGVPSTMNKVVLSSTGSPVLQPYPPNLHNDLVYVQSMEIDPDGVMWILEIGREFWNASSRGGPSLVLYDMAKERLVDRFDFPDEVAPYETNFLNDLVVDVVRRVAYISDAQGPDGAVVVVDMNAHTAARFSSAVTQRDPTYLMNFSYAGLFNVAVPTATDGVALDPSRKLLYFTPLQGLNLYRIPTSSLRSLLPSSSSSAAAAEMRSEDIAGDVVLVGTKTSPADGMTFDENGVLYSGAVADPDNSVFKWDPVSSSGDSLDIAHDAHWADTFAFNGTTLVWVTNNL